MRSHVDVVAARVVLYCALFHDIGIPYCSGRKIVESEIAKESCPDKKEWLGRQAHNFRIEHMMVGAQKAREILTAMRETKDVIDKVCYLISVHDMWKIDKEFSYPFDGDDIGNGIPIMTKRRQFDWNYKLIKDRINFGQDIADRYREICYADTE